MDADRRSLLALTADLATDYLEALGERPVGARAASDLLVAGFGDVLPEEGLEPASVVRELVAAADPGLVASAGPRYFGFVVGGGLPAALAADWLAAAWDQDAGLVALSPAGAAVEQVVAGWLVDVLHLPAGASVGLVTGGQMANWAALAVARHHVLAAVGWDVETEGLAGAPPLRVLVGERRHVSIDKALRMLGLGTRTTPVGVDDAGRMLPDALAVALAGADGPAIVCAQAGEVNGGGFDPFPDVCDAAHAAGAWVHVDGAFGLWAAASARHRHLLEGVERADSWTTDAHKWLNVPYDCGLVFTRHPESHRATFAMHAAYLVHEGDELREPDDWVPEMSRRARGFAVWAALRQLGRRGVEGLVDRCCAHARRFADALGAVDGITVLNDVVLNQVLVRFGDSDDHTDAVIAHVQADGTCWLGGTNWQDHRAMRISVSNWSTTTEDVDRSVDAILRAHASVRP